MKSKKLAVGLLSLMVMMLVFGACSREKEQLARMEYIKSIGNTDPLLAMSMLDSIGWDAKSMSDYALNKWKLLKIRLNDKADMIPTTDKHIVELVEYFDKSGTGRDRQEAYYYAGSVYRDLQDAPRALENFRKSADICLFIDDCDSLLLRNAYSNLHFVYQSVQDYQNGLKTAKQEYEVAKQIDAITPKVTDHVGISLYKTGHEEESKRYFKESLALDRKDPAKHIESIDNLLFYFSRLKMEAEADECYAMVRKYGDSFVSAEKGTTMAAYFYMKNEPDSAAYYYKESLGTDDLVAQSDASKCLYDLYQRMGNEGEELKYARMHIEITSKLDLGLRQEMAATVNNQYQYFLDEQEKARLVAYNERMWLELMIGVLSAALVIACLVVYMQYRKIRMRKELETKAKELSEMTERSKSLDGQLEETMERLEEKESQLKHMSKIMRNKDTMIMQFNKLKAAPDLDYLMERINKVEYSAQDRLTDEEWEMLFGFINMKFPDFYQELMAAGRITSDKHMRACYLMYLSLSDAKISRLLNVSRVTVGRWREFYACAMQKDKEEG